MIVFANKEHRLYSCVCMRLWKWFQRKLASIVCIRPIWQLSEDRASVHDCIAYLCTPNCIYLFWYVSSCLKYRSSKRSELSLLFNNMDCNHWNSFRSMKPIFVFIPQIETSFRPENSYELFFLADSCLEKKNHQLDVQGMCNRLDRFLSL